MAKAFSITLRAKAGKEEELKQTLTRLISPSREEKGCLDYHITQKPDDPRNFMAFMVFENEEAFKQHENSELIQNLRENQLPPLVEQGPDVKDWNDLG